MSPEVDTSALVDLAAHRKAKKEIVDRTLRLDELHQGTYLAADPSLSAFGLVLLEVADSRVAVHLATKFAVTQTPYTGWEDTLVRADILASRLELWLSAWVFQTDWGTVCTVHEAPPMGHGKLMNPEIALLSSFVFRQVTERLPHLGMVRRQDHYRLICGNPNASKQECHKVLKTYYDRISGSDAITNEATRDALQVALFAAAREV